MADQVVKFDLAKEKRRLAEEKERQNQRLNPPNHPLCHCLLRHCPLHHRPSLYRDRSDQRDCDVEVGKLAALKCYSGLQLVK